MASPMQNEKYKVTTPFGVKGKMWSSGRHEGVDNAAPVGAVIVAPCDGKVVKVGQVWGSAFGKNSVLLKVKGGHLLFAHLASNSCKVGQELKKGEVIGKCGKDGNVTGPHLHMELQKGPGWVRGGGLNPQAILDAQPVRIRAALAVALVALLLGAPNTQANELKNSGLKKSEFNQVLKTNNKWQTLQFNGSDAWTLNGDRTLWSAQAHVHCKKKPKYIKMRLARVKPNGKLDTTGTTTWSGIATNKWQGSFLWATRSLYPMVVQIKIKGGKGCHSPIREFKYWQPGVMPGEDMGVPQLP